MSALARLMSVNASTVTRWEDGTSAPDAEALIRLAEELKVRPEFFLRRQHLSDRPMFLRSLSSTLVRDLAYQRAQMRWLQEISAVVQHYVDFPPVDVPDVLQGASYRQLRDEDLEQIALDLRLRWGLGEGPCTDVVALMERLGIVVASIEMGTAKLDGLCSWSKLEGRPHVLLAIDKMSFPRRQMDAAHEMAHALLHRDVTSEEFKKDLKFIEAQAFRLASAFLMPSTSFPIEVGTVSLARLASLKERWRVSIKAQIKRLVDLDIIDDSVSTHLYKLYSAKGWSREEPLDRYWDLQEPKLLSDALHLIVDSNVRTKGDLLALEFTVPAGDVENLCNLPAGWLAREKADVVRLKTARGSDEGGIGPGAYVFNFPGNSD
jgi:Zn-dependent peptidase ImmA (M78 family)